MRGGGIERMDDAGRALGGGGMTGAERSPAGGMSASLSRLLSPVVLGPVELRNRVVSTSHQTSLVHDHLPTEDLVAYHAARAHGGVGGIFLEAIAVHPTGLLTSHTIAGYVPEVVPAYRRMREAVHGGGARLFAQLFHGGREQMAVAPRAPAIAPSAVPTQRFKVEPRALTRGEIRELIDGFAAAGLQAREGGLDGVEVSMAHGYLAAQFFSSISNRRDDEYNGPLAARVRFAREVLEAVREAVGPGVAVGVRLAADERLRDGMGPEGCAEIAAAVCAGGLVDFVSLALGHSATHAASTYIVPPRPAPQDRIASALDVVRAALGDVPVIATTGIVDPADAEELVASGRADAVGMTRALIADPALVAKAARGDEDDIVACIGCNQACIGHYHDGTPIGCVVNPATGRERTLGIVPRSDRARSLLVVGAGPAGVSAALEAASAGQRVTLVERADDLGGQWRIAGACPGHLDAWGRYERLVRRRLAASGVAMAFGREATPQDIDRHDACILASGARPLTWEAPEGGPATVSAPAAIRDPAVVRGPVLVADWGGEWSGLDAAEVLAREGRTVTLATAGLCPGEQIHQYQRNLYLARLDALDVHLRSHWEVVLRDAAFVLRHLFSGREEALGDVATVVVAQGREPDDGPWRDVLDDPRVVRAGDVLGPRGIEEAILEGALAARRIATEGSAERRPPSAGAATAIGRA